MKKYFLITACLLISSILTVTAQDKTEKKEKKSDGDKEIIIRKKGTDKITVVVDGDKVTINGKPVDEWVDGNVEVYSFNEPPVIRTPKPPRIITPRGNWNLSGDKNNTGGKLGVYMKDNDKGAEITEVQENSAAEKAGLKKGDIITKIGDKKVSGSSSLIDAVKSYKAQEEVTVTYLRDGKEKTTKAKLDKRNSFSWNNELNPPTPPFQFDIERELAPLQNLKDMPFGPPGRGFLWKNDNRKFGIKIQDLEEGDGVKVVAVEDSSIALKAGIKKEDIILEIAGDKINNTNEAREALWDNWDKGSFKMVVKRQGNPVTIEVKIPKKIKSADL
jgi:serine protease Do